MIYTPEGNEVAILQQFKEAVVDLNQADVVLLRFLRARDYDLENAEKMLRNAVKWREEIGIDNYLQWEFPPYYQSCVRNLKFGEDFEGAPSNLLAIRRKMACKTATRKWRN
ncbi:SEC14-like protein 2 [Orchesella cincta]|uniref:SEC14-like protein 2 n=1 Tax=Orchesella cincta TaxID=48709 RepID=A0A1D2MIV7_ORCCI|nr:SEC14-like protein 2 [Orchesella cincta]